MKDFEEVLKMDPRHIEAKVAVASVILMSFYFYLLNVIIMC